MSNHKRQKRRSNSFHSNINRKSFSDAFDNDSNEDILSKTINFTKKEMISFKFINNIELTTYDLIFVGRQFSGTATQDFESFIQLLKNIKNKFNSKILKSNNLIENIKKDGKISLTNNNLTSLVLFNKKLKNCEISINSKYIKTLYLGNKFINFYATKSFFKGKHCFELKILNMSEPHLAFGLINISLINSFRTAFKKATSINISTLEQINTESLNIFKLTNPIFYEENKRHYNHFIKYGDILGLCFDIDQKILFIYINGILRGTHILTIETGSNCSFAPIIFIGGYTEIIFNPGENLVYEKKYKKSGFIPLDEKEKNNYELSHLRNVTDEFFNILINNGKSIINNKNISYSDIIQIYHIIFDFLGNISFHHSYIIQNSLIMPFINSYLNKKLDNNELENFYICLKFILNASNDKKLILKNILFNLSENIHILMRNGEEKNLKIIKILFNLFTFIFKKKEIMDILYKMPITTKKLFKSIFISFFISDSFKENNFLDFEVNSLNNNTISISNIMYFPNIKISKNEFNKNIIYAQININNYSKTTSTFFQDLIVSLFNDGIDSQNKNIFKIFKKFLENETNEMFASCFCKRKYRFYDIFKNIFIPAMDLFNEQYVKKNVNISIKKYLKYYEIDGEKIGGTIKYIYEEYAKKIKDFDNLKNYEIKDYNNIFFLEFIYFFFISNNSNDIWETLQDIVQKYIDYLDLSFLKKYKNESYEKINEALIDYINFKLYQFNLDDLKIFIEFLYNFSDFILKELYPNNFVYFLPEKIFLYIPSIIKILKSISPLLKMIEYRQNNDKDDNFLNIFIKDKNNMNLILEEMREKCFNQYISILVKIVGDQNIKKLTIKCESIECIKNYLYINNCFSEEDLYSIFNFINNIHNNAEYKKYAFNFMKIFENDMSLKGFKYYNFGIRLIKIIKDKKDFLRILIILLYNNMNSSLTKLEERFCEYKFTPKSNQNNNIQRNNRINNNNNNQDNNNQDNNNIDNNNIDNNDDEIIINNVNNIFFGYDIIGRINNIVDRLNPFIIFRRVNNAQMTDKEKLSLLEDSFKDTNNQFIKLINFYKLTKEINILYDMNSFENKFLYNLLLSLYNIIFSPNNIIKLVDDKNKINATFKKLLININYFYSTLVTNILEQKNDNLLKEISKRRNMFHFKDILQTFEKINPSKNEKEQDKYIALKNFINIIEKICPEEEILKMNNNDLLNQDTEVTRSGTKIEKNICTICSDSIVDTHILPCEHSICRNCLFHYLSENKVCPYCRVEIKGIKEDPNFKV